MAANTVSGIIGDLDTTILFATSGTLNPAGEQREFNQHRDAILKTAKVCYFFSLCLVHLLGDFRRL